MSEKLPAVISPEIAELYAPINENDRQWLGTLGVVWDAEEDTSDWLTSFNNVVTQGSVHIETGMSEASILNILIAREEFFASCMNIKPETIKGLKALNPCLVPLNTFIATQRLFAAEGINNLIVNERPGLLAYAPGGLVGTINSLKAIGVDVPNVTQKFPAILSYSDIGLSEKISVLTVLGDNLTPVINKAPDILAFAAETTRTRIEHLNHRGLDASKAISYLPSLLKLPVETIDTKLEELKNMGISVSIIDANPVILGYATESVAQKINNLKSLGLDATKVITALPECLGYAPQSIKDKFDKLTSLGLDAAKVINKLPDILYNSQDTLSTKITNLLRLGISTKAIERGPALTNFDPETVKTKLAELIKLGMNAQKVVNSHPAILNLSEDNISRKLTALQDYGLDALAVVETKPGILALTPEKARSKLLLLEAAGRSWGWQEPRKHIARIVQEWPLILTYSPGKLRTLIRVASEAFSPMAAESVSKTQLQALVTNNLEQSVVVYINHRGEISTPKDIVRIAKGYKHLEKAALRTIILGSTNDSVAKIYLRSYPSTK